MRPWFALWIGLAVSASVDAQTTPVAPVITKVKGQVATAVWPDGREAQYWYSRGTEFAAPVPFKVSENGCKPEAVGAEFVSTWNLRLDRVGWIWTKHPDPAKLNQLVMANYGSGRTIPLFSFGFITNNILFLYPDLGPALQKDTYSFSDLSWFPGMENGVRDFTVSVWQAEGMLQNAQTGLAENRVIGGGTQVRLKRTADGVVEWDGATSIYSIFKGEAAFALLGNVVSWKWEMNGQSCWISFKPNLGPINRLVTEKLSSMTQAFEPYLWEQDSLTKVTLDLFTDQGLTYAE